MNLLNLFLLGLGAKMIMDAKKEPTAAQAATGPSPYAPATGTPAAKDPYKRPMVEIHDDNEWGDQGRLREKILRQGSELAMDYAPDYDAMIEQRHGMRALPAEAAPLTIGAKSARLAKANERMSHLVRKEESIMRAAAELAMDFDENDVVMAEEGAVESYKYGKDRAHTASVRKDAALATRAAAIERAEDVRSARENEVRSKRHGRDLARSVRRDVDPNLDMALQQGHKAQMGSAFAQRPEMGFADAQPVSLREGNFDQSEVVASDEFNNYLTANKFYARGESDWPAAVEQKSPVSDFSGVLVNEKGSADFSHEIVYDVKDDFGGGQG